MRVIVSILIDVLARLLSLSPRPLSTLYGFSLLKQAGIYFNKIQCFCFEEQRLKAGEEVRTNHLQIHFDGTYVCVCVCVMECAGGYAGLFFCGP